MLTECLSLSAPDAWELQSMDDVDVFSSAGENLLLSCSILAVGGPKTCVWHGGTTGIILSGQLINQIISVRVDCSTVTCNCILYVRICRMYQEIGINPDGSDYLQGTESEKGREKTAAAKTRRYIPRDRRSDWLGPVKAQNTALGGDQQPFFEI
uniref:Uncharacterized protein n=1 Tax=Romanomermis culicivorax TaxID=13658 RepID=A0A915HTA9_ROMCU